jgi:four helix bundle protein
MLNDFIAFKLAKSHYQLCKHLRLPPFLKGQLLRASSSIALTLAEGSGKRTKPDQIRYYSMALGSLRECQAVLELENVDHKEIQNLQSQLGAILFKLSGVAKTPNTKPSNTKLPTD